MTSTRQYAKKAQQLKDAAQAEIEEIRRMLRGPLSEEEKANLERRLGDLIGHMEEKRCGLTGQKNGSR